MSWSVVAGLWIAGVAVAAPVDPAKLWKPMQPFVGTWQGARTSGTGSVKVTREFVAAATNHHLEIVERISGRKGPHPWGQVVAAAGGEALVLERAVAEGGPERLTLEDPAGDGGRLVFVSPGMRVTFEREGARAFVERVEWTGPGAGSPRVEETRFVRRD